MQVSEKATALIRFIAALYATLEGEVDNAVYYLPAVAFLWKTGQWSIALSSENAFLGWVGWYKLNDELLTLFQEQKETELITNNIKANLIEGDHCYVAFIVIAPWAPKNTCRDLYNDVLERNKGSRSITWRHARIDGEYKIIHKKLST